MCEAIAHENPYAVAIIDMQMPGINGMQLAQAIKSDHITKDTRVIMLTGFGGTLDGEYQSEFVDLVRLTGITAQLGDRFERPTEPRHDRFCSE